MLNRKRIVKRVIAMALVVSTIAGVTINHVKSKASEVVKKENTTENVITISKFEDWTKVDLENIEDVNFDNINIEWDKLEAELYDVMAEMEEEKGEKVIISIGSDAKDRKVTATFAKYKDQLDTMTLEELDSIFDTEQYRKEFDTLYGLNKRGKGDIWESVLKIVSKIDLSKLQELLDKLLTRMENNPKFYLIGLPMAITGSIVAVILAKKIPDVMKEKFKAEAGNDWMKKLAQAYIKNLGNKDKFAESLRSEFSDEVIRLFMEWYSSSDADITQDDIIDLKDEIENNEDLEEIDQEDIEEEEEPNQEEIEDIDIIDEEA